MVPVLYKVLTEGFPAALAWRNSKGESLIGTAVYSCAQQHRCHSSFTLGWSRIYGKDSSKLEGWRQKDKDCICLFLTAHWLVHWASMCSHPPRREVVFCVPLNQQFSTFLKLQRFNTVPHVVVTWSTKLFSVLLHNYHFATAMVHTVNICVFCAFRWPLWMGPSSTSMGSWLTGWKLLS